jgi:hypothetical protein
VDANTGTNVVVNPLGNKIDAQLATKLVDMSDIAFHFRKEKGEDGKPIPGVEKRPSYKAKLPLLTMAGIAAALAAGDKTTTLVVEAVNEVIIDRFRGLINDQIEKDSKVALADSLFDMNLLSLVAIANLPKSERGAGISKELWAAFVTDYVATMQTPKAIAMFPDKTARPLETLQKHGVILGGKFNPVRSRKDIIQQMLGFIDIWAGVTENLEENLTCYEHLKAKGNALLTAEDFNNL